MLSFIADDYSNQLKLNWGNQVMTEEEMGSVTKSRLKQNVKESAEKLEKIAKEAKVQTLDVVNDAEQKITAEVEELSENIHSQVAGFKQELFNRFEIIKGQVNLSQQDFIALKNLVGSELNNVMTELAQLGQDIKQDVGELSSKHKDQLAETLKRTKAHTLDVWNKLSIKQ